MIPAFCFFKVIAIQRDFERLSPGQFFKHIFHALFFNAHG